MSNLLPRPMRRHDDTDEDEDEKQYSDEELDEESANEAANEGSLCEVKTLYEGPEKKCDCCIDWVDENPEDSKQTKKQTEMKRYAFIIRLKKNHDDGKSLVLDSIVVQSSHLKKLLVKVFEGCSGITPTLKKLVLKAPFWSFYYRWDIFTEVVQHQLYADAAAQAELFYTTLKAELKSTMSEVKDLLKNGVMTFQKLWALFEPGTKVYHHTNGHDRFYQVDSCEYKQTNCGEFLVVQALYVDWDGKRFGFAQSELAIPKFSGTKPIIELPIFPAQYHPSLDAVNGALLKRGKQFEELSGFNYTAYSGTVEWVDRDGGNDKVIQRNVEGRIVIDAKSHALFNPRDRIHVFPLDFASQMRVTDISDGVHGRSRRDRMFVIWPRENDERYKKFLEPAVKKANGNNLSGPLLLLCTPHVRGYCLKIKQWVRFHVDCVQPIRWNNAFQNLVLPEDYKSMILAFVESQVTNKGAFDDVVQGKGQGLIIMLAGTPGIGKTLTAEAVADKLRRPLYMLGTGELGVNADDVEDNLRTVLDITARWNAVLLIDESDVFLEKRAAHDLARNKVVAVFLRLLEYYSGIMFMTTNRADTLDPAFQSRIHLTIQYPSLDKAARRHIWASLVNSSDPEHALKKADLDYLASLEMNGRQIKNSVKTAQLLASSKRTSLHRDHFQQVLKITQGVSDPRVGSRSRWIFHQARKIRDALRFTKETTVKGPVMLEDERTNEERNDDSDRHEDGPSSGA